VQLWRGLHLHDFEDCDVEAGFVTFTRSLLGLFRGVRASDPPLLESLSVHVSLMAQKTLSPAHEEGLGASTSSVVE
jgi:hypothetical protein